MCGWVYVCMDVFSDGELCVSVVCAHTHELWRVVCGHTHVVATTCIFSRSACMHVRLHSLSSYRTEERRGRRVWRLAAQARSSPPPPCRPLQDRPGPRASAATNRGRGERGTGGEGEEGSGNGAHAHVRESNEKRADYSPRGPMRTGTCLLDAVLWQHLEVKSLAEAINHMREHGVSRFDFEGVAVDSEPDVVAVKRLPPLSVFYKNVYFRFAKRLLHALASTQRSLFRLRTGSRCWQCASPATRAEKSAP